MTKDLPPVQDWLGDYATETLGAVVDQAVAMLAGHVHRGHLGLVTLAAIRATGLDELHRRAHAEYTAIDPNRPGFSPQIHCVAVRRFVTGATIARLHHILSNPDRYSRWLARCAVEELHTRALAARLAARPGGNDAVGALRAGITADAVAYYHTHTQAQT